MDLKFSFDGASSDHSGHGDAPSASPLPLSTAPLSGSSDLDAHARWEGGGTPAARIVGEIRTAEGVVYASAEVTPAGSDEADVAKAVRSALARAVAGLEAPVKESVRSVSLALDGAEAAVLATLGVTAQPAQVTEALQQRIGVPVGSPIDIAA